uniref:Uncharacterized protein LOC100176175 n=1 Tax=Phallusia mammillata TaxID=59560 RepID=A0A6F9DFP6_9ASCI|nr:uncharacterized protein LOC100176175 [Phallusia mammillata]
MTLKMTRGYFDSVVTSRRDENQRNVIDLCEGKQQRRKYISDAAEAQQERLRNNLEGGTTNNTTGDCLAALIFNNVIRNGMFSLSQLVGYTQFMVFVIIRLIICGALAGRLFANDVKHIFCDATRSDNTTQLDEDSVTLNPFNDTVEIRETCLRIAYHGSISPLIGWALTLLTSVIPWLVVLPWTPFEIGQDYVRCPLEGCKWPCLTTFISAFIRAITRLILEITAFVGIIVAYRMYVPKYVSCYDDTITCVLPESEEKTCFLWMLTCINAITAGLSVWEIFHMYTNKELYDKDMPDTYAFREIRCDSSYLAQSETKAVMENDWSMSRVGKERPSTSTAPKQSESCGKENGNDVGISTPASDCLEDPF